VESCLHHFPHEKVDVVNVVIGNYHCVEWEFCSSVGIKVKCEKVVSH